MNGVQIFHSAGLNLELMRISFEIGGFSFTNNLSRFNPYSPGYAYVSSASRDMDMHSRTGGPSTGIRVHE